MNFIIVEDTSNIAPVKKRFNFLRFIKRTILTLSISVVSVILLSVLLVVIYEDDVKAIIVKELNMHLNAEVRIDPKNINFTVLKSFPHCALEFNDVTIMEVSDAKVKDTLLFAEKLSLAFSIKDVFNKNYNIQKIHFENGKANLKVYKNGKANYEIWKTDSTVSKHDSLNFSLQKITLQNIVFHYKNSQAKIKIETHLKKINFKGQFSDSHYTLSADGNSFVSLFQVEKTKYIIDKNLKFDLEIDVNGNNYIIKHSETSVNATKLISSGDFVIQDSLLSLNVLFKGEKLDISSTLSLLPEKYQKQINDYKSDGEFYANGKIKYAYNSPISINAQFGIRNANITYKPQNSTLTNVNLSGSIDVNKGNSNLLLQNISANLKSNTFSGNVQVQNFNDPFIKLNVTAKTNLNDLLSFYPVDTIQEMSGNIDINANLSGLISDFKKNTFTPDIKAEGVASIKNVQAKFKNSTKHLNISQGELKLTNRGLSVNDLKIVKGTSDLTLTGIMPNFLGYLFDSNIPLVVNAKVVSENIELEDLLFKSGNKTGSSAISISDKLDFNVNVDVKHIAFGKFHANNIIGNVLLKDQKIALKDVSLQAADGTIKLNAFADASGKSLKVSGDCDLEKLNIKKLFTELNNFGQNTLQDKHIKGFVTAHVSFTAAWDENLKVNLNSISATSTILIERGELIAFKPLESLAKYIDVNELRHIKFSSLQSIIDIKDQMIIIPKTSIKSSAINIDFRGRHSFDNIVDYHIQLLLSELLSKKQKANKNFDDELTMVENDPENRRSVFIVMTGPIDSPTIKYDRKGAKEKIREDIKQEKQTMKQILKEEFGLFKKDSIKIKNEEKANQKFKIEFGDEKPKKDNPLQPKKKEEDDDDF